MIYYIYHILRRRSSRSQLGSRCAPCCCGWCSGQWINGSSDSDVSHRRYGLRYRRDGVGKRGGSHDVTTVTVGGGIGWRHCRHLSKHWCRRPWLSSWPHWYRCWQCRGACCNRRCLYRTELHATVFHTAETFPRYEARHVDGSHGGNVIFYPFDSDSATTGFWDMVRRDRPSRPQNLL